MIPAGPATLQHAIEPTPPTPNWRQAWRDAVRDPRELLSMLGLDHLAGSLSDAAAAQFPLRVPRGFVARMRHGDPHDPLLRQVLPILDEERIVPGFGLDAVGDEAARRGGGVIHKYNGRALLIATGSCAVHCRYCFRRHYPYAEDTAAAAGWQEAVALIAGDPSIQKPVLNCAPALSERVDAGLLAWLRGLPWPVAVVVHANHANEFDAAVDAAMAALHEAGATLLNQAVLLRGVNDSVDALAALCERGYRAGVLPYYLHQLDRVAGAAHFEVEDARALALHAGLAARLPGYLVPKLVREVAGELGKTPLASLGSGIPAME